MPARLQLIAVAPALLLIILFPLDAPAQDAGPIQFHPPILIQSSERAEMDFAAATAAFLRGEYDKAADRFAAAYSADPELRLALYWEGVSASAAGDFARAEDRLRQYISAEPYPDRSPAQFDLAVALIGQERWQEALQSLDRAATAPDPRSEISYYRGLCLAKTENCGEARRALDQALVDTPSLKDRIFALMAACDLLEGDVEAAAQNVRAALSITEDEALREELAQSADVLERSGRLLRWWACWIRIGAGWDSNPQRASDDINDASMESGFSDASAQALLLPLHRANVRQWIGYRFDGRLHWSYERDRDPDAGDYDLIRNRALAGIEGRLTAGSVVLQPSLGYEFSHVIMGGEEYELEHRVDPELTVMESQYLATRLAYSFLHDDYSEADDPDSGSHRAQCDQFFLFWDGSGRINLGIGGEIRDAASILYNRNAWWILIGLEAPIVQGFRVDAAYNYRVDDYPDHPDRRGEKRHLLGLGLSRAFWRHLTVEARFLWSDVVGEPKIFSYSRTMSGLRLRWDF